MIYCIILKSYELNSVVIKENMFKNICMLLTVSAHFHLIQIKILHYHSLMYTTKKKCKISLY